MSVSNNRYIKGITNGIEIAHKIALAAKSPVTFIIVGPITNNLRECIAQLCRPGIKTDSFEEFFLDNLVIRSYGQQEDVISYLQVSDLFVNASYHDSFNLSICEALACGLPVISSSVVGMREHIGRSCVGIFFEYPPMYFEDMIAKKNVRIPELQLNAITEFSKRLFDDKDFYQKISSEASGLIERKLSWGSLKERYTKIFTID